MPVRLAGNKTGRIPFPADPAGILFLADSAEPVTVGVADLADAGILFPAIPAGILFPTDPARILFPAELAEPVTVGVADLADAGILFPAVPAGIPFPTDPAGILFPAELAEPVTVGVADLADAGILFPAVPARILFPADLAEPVTVGVADVNAAGLFTMEMADVMETVDGIPIYYGGDYDGLWDPEYDDIGYMGNFDGQSESSDYEEPLG